MSQQIIEDIKAIVKKTVRAMRVPDFFMGVVSETEPLKIESSVNKRPYPQSVLYVPDSVGELKKDDNVILLRGLGGQRFLVVGTLGKTQSTEPEPEEPEEPDPNACPYGNECKWCPRNDQSGETGGGDGGDTEEEQRHTEDN